jgi:4'-phosphopantetheinyl transferase
LVSEAQPILLASRADTEADGVDVWLADTEPARDPDVLGRCSDLITEGEREACASFRHEADRRRAFVARALLRTTLSRYADVRPEDWRFERGIHGRPEIAGPAAAGLRFNLSHTRDLVACAVTFDAAIGVDVEKITGDTEDPAVLASVCTPAEIEELSCAEPGERERRFLELWTLKEAYLKALGVGLARSPRSASFAARSAGEKADWWFSVRVVGDDHVLALARNRRARPVRLTILRAAAPFPHTPGSSHGR